MHAIGSIRLLLILSIVTASVHANAAGAHHEVELLLERDGNPARAETGEGVDPELIQSMTLSSARSFRIDERSGWVVHAMLALRLHSLYHGLDEASVQAGASYRIQPEVGYTAPWYEFGLRGERSQRANSSIRDLIRIVATASTGAHLTDRITAGAGVRLTRAIADGTGVFDQSERALDLDASYRLSDAALAYLHWASSRGDQAFGAPDAYTLGGNVKAVAQDPALGTERYVYRMAGRTHSLDLGTFITSGHGQFWNFSFRRTKSVNLDGAAYFTDQVSAGWRHPF